MDKEITIGGLPAEKFQECQDTLFDMIKFVSEKIGSDNYDEFLEAANTVAMLCIFDMSFSPALKAISSVAQGIMENRKAPETIPMMPPRGMS